jgi:hypothetical protein
MRGIGMAGPVPLGILGLPVLRLQQVRRSDGFRPQPLMPGPVPRRLRVCAGTIPMRAGHTGSGMCVNEGLSPRGKLTVSN